MSSSSSIIMSEANDGVHRQYFFSPHKHVPDAVGSTKSRRQSGFTGFSDFAYRIVMEIE